MDGAMLERIFIDETIEVFFQLTGHFRGSPRAGAISQALGALLGKALHPFAEGRIGKVEHRGDSMNVVARDDLTDGLCAAKDARLLRLLEHGL
jgi:hypothetical protein